MRVFDFLYVLSALFYKRLFKTRSRWESQGILVLSIIQFLILFLPLFILYCYLQFDGIYLKLSGIVCPIFIYFNNKRYEKRFNYFKENFSYLNLTRNSLIIFLPFVVLIVLAALIFLIGIVSHKLRT